MSFLYLRILCVWASEEVKIREIRESCRMREAWQVCLNKVCELMNWSQIPGLLRHPTAASTGDLIKNLSPLVHTSQPSLDRNREIFIVYGSIRTITSVYGKIRQCTEKYGNKRKLRGSEIVSLTIKSWDLRGLLVGPLNLRDVKSPPSPTLGGWGITLIGALRHWEKGVS